MRNKRGILGAIFGAIIVVVFLIGFLIYSQIKTNGLIFSTGDVTIKIDYNKSENNQMQNNTPLIDSINTNEIGINQSLEDENKTFITVEEINGQAP